MPSQVVIHRAPPRVGRVARVLLAVVVIAGVTGIVAYTAKHVTGGAAACDPDDGVALRVVAAPDIAPAITQIADRWVTTHPSASGQCVRVTVVAGTTVAPADGGQPDGAAMWIPDSSTWIARQQQTDRSTFSGSTVSIATSPVVFAVSAKNTAARKAAGALLSSDGRLDLTRLGGAVDQTCTTGRSAPFSIALDDPMIDAASLAAMSWFGAEVADPNCEMAFLRGIGHDDDRGALLTAVAAGRSGAAGADAVPLPEQAVLTYDAGHPTAPLAAIAPEQSSTVLDYPAAIYAGLPAATSTAAALFRDQLATPAAAAVLAHLGFRAVQGSVGAGFPALSGLNTAPVVPTSMESVEPLEVAGGLWKAASYPGRALALVDSGPEMATRDGSGPSRVQLVTSLAGDGLALFQPQDELGVWSFGGAASANKAGYTPVVQPAPLGTSQRKAIAGILGGVAPAGVDDCGFYPAVLAAYKYMAAHFDDTRANTLVVFTDTTDGCGKSLATLESDLQQQASLDKPIALIILSFGPDVDAKALKALSATVSGRVTPVVPSTRIQVVFMEALREIASSLTALSTTTN